MPQPHPIQFPSESEKDSVLASFYADQRAFRLRADAASRRLQTAAPQLIEALRTDTGQSEKIRQIIWSCWNGRNKVGLGDVLCGLDHRLAEAVLAVIEARLFFGGDADGLIRHILDQSGEMDRFQTSGHSIA